MAPHSLEDHLISSYMPQQLRMPVIYERRLCVQAFIIYEESIPDSNAERRALYSIVGALQRCTTLSAESRDTLVHKARGYSAKLLKKSDQCRAICACSHLFWQSNPNVSLICVFSSVNSSKDLTFYILANISMS